MRAAPSTTDGKVIAARVPGETVNVEKVEKGWAKLQGQFKGHDMWMLIDGTGTAPGVGVLLEPAKPSKPKQTGGKPAEVVDSDDDDDDNVFLG